MVTFEQCVGECLRNREFVTEFDRLWGTSLGGVRGRNVVVAMVDQAAGFDEERSRRDMEKFVAFVYETVWLRLDPSERAPQEVRPPAGKSFAELVGESR